MKTPNRNTLSQAGFTVAEGVISAAILVVLGLVFFQVLNSGMVLYAKNTAVNSAHQEARDGINRLTRDIHASVAIPQLRDAAFNIVSSTPVGGVPPSAAGVSFQNIAFGPQYVWKDPSGNGPIMVKGGLNNLAPSEGMHILSPFFNVEDDIIKVTATPTQANHHNIWLAGGGETLMANKVSLYGQTGATYSVLYYTNRVMYLVKNGSYIPDSKGLYTLTTATYSSGKMERYKLSNGSYVADSAGTITLTPTLYTSGSAQRYRYEKGELHRYVQDYASNAVYWKDSGIVARYISSPTPFYIPLNTGGSANTKYVGVKLSARDPSSSNRGYLSTATLLDTQIDFRSRIALYQ